MKSIFKILILVLVILGALIAYTVSNRGGNGPAPTTAVPVEQARQSLPDEAEDDIHMAARVACREFLLQTLDNPDDAELDNYEIWKVTQRPEGTLEVTLVGRVMDGLGEMIDARWSCVVFPETQQMRLVSLAMIETGSNQQQLDDIGVESTDLAPRPNLESLEETRVGNGGERAADVGTFSPQDTDETDTEAFDPAREAEREAVFQ